MKIWPSLARLVRIRKFENLMQTATSPEETSGAKQQHLDRLE
jgi:hypothetical protein